MTFYRVPRVRCALVGPGMTKDNADLVALVKAHNLWEQVLLLGPRDDIPAVMNALDTHVLSSSFGEAFPNVVAEAMACGTPPIVTDVGDAALIVGDCGWVVAPKDAVRLAGAIADAMAAMGCAESWQARKQACRERVTEEFSLARMTAAYRAVWQEAVAATRG